MGFTTTFAHTNLPETFLHSTVNVPEVAVAPNFLQAVPGELSAAVADCGVKRDSTRAMTNNAQDITKLVDFFITFTALRRLKVFGKCRGNPSLLGVNDHLRIIKASFVSTYMMSGLALETSPEVV